MPSLLIVRLSQTMVKYEVNAVYPSIYLLVVYGRTRKNIQRYYTPKRPIKIYELHENIYEPKENV